ncbi:MAG: CPBP family intramembrane metalloprotease [Planctomycetota bacterium]|nr:MAG: CPBP family intramembrane metalloprotease [Planctomycetota bacterium]
MPLFAELLSLGIALAGLTIWGWVGVQWLRDAPLFDFPVPVTRPRGRAAVLLAGLWLGQSLWAEWTRVEQPLVPVSVTRNQAAESIALNSLIQCLVGGLFLFVLSEGNQRGLNRYGMTLRGWKRSIWYGVCGYLASVVPVFLAMWMMQPFRSEATIHPYLQLLHTEGSAFVVILLFFTAAILAPLVEELIFRVALQGSLRQWLSPLPTLVISSAIFSAVHGFPDAVGLFPLAMILGYLYWRTGSYLAAVVAHACFNSVNMAMMLLQEPGTVSG